MNVREAKVRRRQGYFKAGQVDTECIMRSCVFHTCPRLSNGIKKRWNPHDKSPKVLTKAEEASTHLIKENKSRILWIQSSDESSSDTHV